MRGEKKAIEIGGQTFIINIKGTDNNTWQGTILWAQTQQKIPFRSVLELIHLLDSAIGTSEVNNLKWGGP